MDDDIIPDQSPARSYEEFLLLKMNDRVPGSKKFIYEVMSLAYRNHFQVEVAPGVNPTGDIEMRIFNTKPTTPRILVHPTTMLPPLDEFPAPF